MEHAERGVTANGADQILQDEVDDPLQLTLRLASEEHLPLELGRIELTEDGGVRLRASESQISFNFTYRGVPFAGTVQGEKKDTLRLVGVLGKLPYSAECAASRQLVRRISESTASLPGRRMTISRDQKVQLVAEQSAPKPHTPVSFIATAAAMLLDFKPFLELAQEVLAGFPESVPGAAPAPQG